MMFEEDDELEVLAFEDEEGQLIEMIVLKRFELDGQTYVQVLDKASEEGETYVFKQTSENDEISYEQIDDDDEWVKVVAVLDEEEDPEV